MRGRNRPPAMSAINMHLLRPGERGNGADPKGEFGLWELHIVGGSAGDVSWFGDAGTMRQFGVNVALLTQQAH
jgi:hypothetical protein